MVISKEKAKKRFDKLYEEKRYQEGISCPVCHKRIYPEDDPAKWEYIKTKRRTEVFIHTKCIKDWSDD